MIHTLQLVSPPMFYSDYRRIEKLAYDHAKCGLYRITDRKKYLLAFKLVLHPGVRVCLNELTVPHIAIVVNPALILGGGYQDLCDLTPKSLDACMKLIAGILQEFDVAFTADQLLLSRIDCTVDVQFPEEHTLDAFIACIQHTNLPRDYHIERFGMRYPNYKEMNRHSFRMACNDVGLTIYDKTYQLLNEDLIEENEIPSGRLRFEAAFCNPAFQRLFVKYGGGIFFDDTDATGDVRKIILRFSSLSIQILKDYFKTHMSPGQYLRKDLACERIDRAPLSAKVKFRMKKMLDEVARCHKGGISAALKNMERDGFRPNELQYLLKCFEKIDLNPATIGIAAKCRELPSIAELLDGEDRFIIPFSGS